MKADIDLDAGTVHVEFTLAEYQEVIAALAAQKKTAEPAKPKLPSWPRTFQIESETDYHKVYAVRIWLDERGYKQGECTCPHNRYRKAWCKHLSAASLQLVRELARLS